jgi:hypothetical protein
MLKLEIDKMMNRLRNVGREKQVRGIEDLQTVTERHAGRDKKTG